MEKCIYCEFGYTLDHHEQICNRCNTAIGDDLKNPQVWNLPLCDERGIRWHSGLCTCQNLEAVNGIDEAQCQFCSKGCVDCTRSDENGLPVCNECVFPYILYADMPHLCAYISNLDTLPMGWGFRGNDNSKLITDDEFVELFEFDLTYPLYDHFYGERRTNYV